MEASYQKINDKRYSIRLNGELKDIEVPYAKARSIFEAFVRAGGSFGEDGAVQTELMTIIHSFGAVGDIVLSKFGPKGEVLDQGDCSELSVGEVASLFEMASEISGDFMDSISAIQKKESGAGVRSKGTATKEKKAK